MRAKEPEQEAIGSVREGNIHRKSGNREGWIRMTGDFKGGGGELYCGKLWEKNIL